MNSKTQGTRRTYIIELLCEDKVWEKSWAYPSKYTYTEAEALINGTLGGWRIVNTPKRPYRRPAATPLELRGAYAMLESARKYVINGRGAGAYDPWVILTGASDDIKRALEAL